MIMRVAMVALLFPSAVLGMAASPEPDLTLSMPTEDIYVAASLGAFDPMDDFMQNTSFSLELDAETKKGLTGTECARPCLPPLTSFSAVTLGPILPPSSPFPLSPGLFLFYFPPAFLCRCYDWFQSCEQANKPCSEDWNGKCPAKCGVCSASSTCELAPKSRSSVPTRSMCVLL